MRNSFHVLFVTFMNHFFFCCDTAWINCNERIASSKLERIRTWLSNIRILLFHLVLCTVGGKALTTVYGVFNPVCLVRINFLLLIVTLRSRFVAIILGWNHEIHSRIHTQYVWLSCNLKLHFNLNSCECLHCLKSIPVHFPVIL